MAEQGLSNAQTVTYSTLISMGFDKEQSITAAKIFGANADDAINYVLDNPISTNNNTFQTGILDDPFNFDDAVHDNNDKNEVDAPITTFRINYISRLFINGVFHEPSIDNKIFPSDIQNVILKYTNLLFTKLRYNINHKLTERSDGKADENNIHYLSFEKDITLGDIALLIEKQSDYQYDDFEKKNDCDYAQFIHLWLKFKQITFLQLYHWSDDEEKNNVSHDKWVELPADSEKETLNRLDKINDDENIFVEIAVEKYDQKLNKWPFQSQDFSIEALSKGDIIDAFCKKHNKWFESVVLCVDDVIQVRFIGLKDNEDALAYEYIEKRGTNTNGPDRRNWWRRLLDVGYKLDVYDQAYRKWYTSEIAEIGKDKQEGHVKIHYDGYSSNYDEWVETDSECLALLNTYTSPDPFWGPFNYEHNIINRQAQ